MIKIKSKSKNKVNEKLDRLIALHEHLAEELETIRQEQSYMQQTIFSIETILRKLKYDNFASLAESIDEVKSAAQNMNDSARLILLTSIMDNIDELVGNKPACTTSSHRTAE